MRTTTVGRAPGTNQTYVGIVEELRKRLCIFQVVLGLGRSWYQEIPGKFAAPQDNPQPGEKVNKNPCTEVYNEDLRLTCVLE